MTKITSMSDGVRNLRGIYEDLYGNQVLNQDVIESIVDEFAMSASWIKGATPTDAVSEAKILRKTLTFSSNYEAKQ